MIKNGHMQKFVMNTLLNKILRPEETLQVGLFTFLTGES